MFGFFQCQLPRWIQKAPSPPMKALWFPLMSWSCSDPKQMESVIYTTFCLGALLTHCSLVSLDISTVAGWLFWNDTENISGGEPERGPWRKSNQWGSSDRRSFAGPMPSGCALSSGGRKKNLFAGWAGWWVVVGWSVGTTLAGMLLRLGIENDGEKEGSSEMCSSVKIHGGPFQGIKTTRCVQPLPGAPRSNAEVCAASFLLQLRSNHFIMFIWVTHLSLTFPSPALYSLSQSKFGVFWNVPRTERSAMKPKMTIFSSAASLRASMIVSVRQLSTASSHCPDCWMRRGEGISEIGYREEC